MASYTQRGQKMCPSCKKKCGKTFCPACGARTKTSGLWSVRFSLLSGGIRTCKRLSGFERKSDAEAAYRDFMQAHRPENEKEMTFDVLFEKYKEYAKSELKTSSYFSVETRARLHVLPSFKGRNVAEIQPREVLEWKQKMEKELPSHAMRSSVYYALSAIIKFGNTFYNLGSRALVGVGNFVNREIKKEMQIWGEADFKRFIAAVTDETYNTLFTLLYLSGCRRGEVLALKWADYYDSSININKTVNYKSMDGEAYEITSPKTKPSVRSVPLPAAMCKKLDEYKKTTPGEGYIFGGDSPLPRTNVHRAFENGIKLSEVKKIRIHDLRHSHASLLFNKGADILQIAKRLGHSDVSQLLNRYAHLSPARQDALLSKIDLSF